MESKIKFGLTESIRRRYGELMNPSRFTHPRITRLGHALSWYVDGHVAERPTIGLYSLAVLAEFLLRRARRRSRRSRCTMNHATREATEFFAATRRTMDCVIHCGCKAGKDLSPKKVCWLRATVENLCERGRAVVKAQEGPAVEDERHRMLREWKESFYDRLYSKKGATRCRMI